MIEFISVLTLHLEDANSTIILAADSGFSRKVPKTLSRKSEFSSSSNEILTLSRSSGINLDVAKKASSPFIVLFLKQLVKLTLKILNKKYQIYRLINYQEFE